MNKQKVDKIIKSYLQKIYGFSIKKSFSYQEAEDLSSDIVSELYLSLLKAEEIYNIDGYVWRISNHVYAKYVAHKKKHEGISIDGIVLPFEEDFYAVEMEEELVKLRLELAFLTKIRRTIVYSYYYESKSIAEISNTLKIPTGTVKWHLNKARNDIKGGFTVERKIGKLGLNPVKARFMGSSGYTGTSGPTSSYLRDILDLNIVYSVYFEPKTMEEIAEELGVIPVFIEEKIDFLEENGFLIRQAKNKFTTFVRFTPTTYSLELRENKLKKQLEVAQILVKEYVPKVLKATQHIKGIYIPGGNRELFEAACVFYAIDTKLRTKPNNDISKYYIKTTTGGNFIAKIELEATQSDTEYTPVLKEVNYDACGGMYRTSDKYPVFAWSVDTRYSSRKGAYQNNLTSDYEYLYEYMTSAIKEDFVNSLKFNRLKERDFLTNDNNINIMVLKSNHEQFISMLPELDDKFRKKYAEIELEFAEIEAKNYPAHMYDLNISWGVGGFVTSKVALMVLDILYENGTFKALTEREKLTSNLIMLSDILPNE